MTERLLNIREAADFLGVGERAIKEMVDTGELPAYKIGGTFLRFKESQLILTRTALQNKQDAAAGVAGGEPAAPAGKAEAIKDFLYFNDFYILSIIVIVAAIALMIAT